MAIAELSNYAHSKISYDICKVSPTLGSYYNNSYCFVSLSFHNLLVCAMCHVPVSSSNYIVGGIGQLFQ